MVAGCRVPHTSILMCGHRAKHDPLSSSSNPQKAVKTGGPPYRSQPSTNHKRSGAPSFAPFAKGGNVNCSALGGRLG